ncbi:MAG: lamin tail domain-containing protein [Prevotellaceae bacterium]|jgi:hypothetical protein|nr:lamin tail domain-containing protein [Prevotellaceae bacterium]
MKKLITIVLFFSAWCARAQFSDDFENGALAGWLQAPAGMWSASSASGRLSGGFSLRHSSTLTQTTDWISAPVEAFSLDEGMTTWRFLMRYNYNPTTNNKWAVVLMSDTSATAWEAGAGDGYAVGVNQAVGISDKLLCLYAIHDNNFTEVIKTTVNWNTDIGTSTSTTVAMEIVRSADGEWNLYLAKSNRFDSLQWYGSAVHTDYLQAHYFGAVNTYTSASSGGQKLWLDDIYIRSSAFPAKIAAVRQQGRYGLLVDFSHPMQTSSMQTAENYTLATDVGNLYPQTVDIQSSQQALLTFADLLPRGRATLRVERLRDANNNAVDDHWELSILYHLYGDVVINEIMAASAPSVGLPEINYIELYNRLATPVPLNGWKLEFITTSSGNVVTGNIDPTTIPANGYLILCARTAVEDMHYYGETTGLTNISSLTQTGKTLRLKDSDGGLLAHLTYAGAWITEDTKRAGGWSLEKIDADNLSENPSNWAASEDAAGGTPGRQNAVQRPNPDIDAPFITDLQNLSRDSLRLTFNELFDTLAARRPECYSVDNGVGHPQQVAWDASRPLQVTLIFAGALEEKTLYALTISTPFCDLAGNAPLEEAYTFGRLMPPQPDNIVINEILFNPYVGGVDFVELYNRSDAIFDLRSVRLANRDGEYNVASVRAVEQKHFLRPGDYAVLTTDINAVQLFYDVPHPEKVVTMSSLPAYSDDAGHVVLLSESGAIIDELAYTAKMHHAFIVRPEGVSLERVNPERPTAETANWQSAAEDKRFATPTEQNSQYNPAQADGGEGYFSLPFPVFSPDGDGYNDVLFIDYRIPEAGYVATITVYDIHGRLVREIAKKALLGVDSRFHWDGVRYDNHQAIPGIYLIFIEYFDRHGNVKQVKMTCAVAMR